MRENPVEIPPDLARTLLEQVQRRDRSAVVNFLRYAGLEDKVESRSVEPGASRHEGQDAAHGRPVTTRR